jgi:hypothetical protein
MTWSNTFLKALKDNDVRLVSYVPDNVLPAAAARSTLESDRANCLAATMGKRRLTEHRTFAVGN